MTDLISPGKEIGFDDFHNWKKVWNKFQIFFSLTPSHLHFHLHHPCCHPPPLTRPFLLFSLFFSMCPPFFCPSNPPSSFHSSFLNTFCSHVIHFMMMGMFIGRAEWVKKVSWTTTTTISLPMHEEIKNTLGCRCHRFKLNRTNFWFDWVLLLRR